MEVLNEIKYLKNYVEKIYKKNDPAHDFEHIMRVYRNAERICQSEKANKKLVDEVFEIVNSREKVLRVLMMAKSAIRHNMKEDLPKIKQKTCIIWGENDKITPPDVGHEFHSEIPNSDIFWIDKCGHAPMIEQPNKFNKILVEWLKNNL